MVQGGVTTGAGLQPAASSQLANLGCVSFRIISTPPPPSCYEIDLMLRNQWVVFSHHKSRSDSGLILQRSRTASFPASLGPCYEIDSMLRNSLVETNH